MSTESDEPAQEGSIEFDVNNPHDHFFRHWLGDAERASGFFLYALPESLHSWVRNPGNLNLQDASFVSEELKGSQSDLLWKCEDTGAEKTPRFVYVLFEHQSQPDRMMVARMLFYIVRIWERFLATEGKGQSTKLPFVFPLVLYQGRANWNEPRRLSDLIELPEESMRRYVPEMEFELKSLKEMDLDHITPAMLRLGLSAMTLVIEGGFSDWLEKLIIEDEQARDVEYAGFGVVLRYAFVIASPTEREAMIEVIDEKKQGGVVKEARSLYEAILFEGMEKGIEKGRAEGLSNSVKNMHGKDFSAEQIADILGLPLAEVNEFLESE